MSEWVVTRRLWKNPLELVAINVTRVCTVRYRNMYSSRYCLAPVKCTKNSLYWNRQAFSFVIIYYSAFHNGRRFYRSRKLYLQIASLEWLRYANAVSAPSWKYFMSKKTHRTNSSHPPPPLLQNQQFKDNIDVFYSLWAVSTSFLCYIFVLFCFDVSSPTKCDIQTYSVLV